jgi:transcriptional regulator with PAS, ATPase and Fis domain
MSTEDRFAEIFLYGDRPQTFERHWAHESQNLDLHGLPNQLASVVSPGGLIGLSQPMRMIHDLIRKATDRPFPVLISGETGTGKELVARSIHNLGLRRSAPFVAVDCSSLSQTLIETELFGHLRGAFTGADAHKKGLVEAADTGTLFLDEIGELPPELQAKLLRVIQEHEVRPVGSAYAKLIDVRFIAATHRDLRVAVANGRFRSDLYYRLNVIPIAMPPLRERKADIPLLVTAFLAKHADPARPIDGISDDFWCLVNSFNWPGNVRELENFVVRSIALGSGPVLRNADGYPIPEEIADGCPAQDSQCLAALERRAIMKALEATKGDKIAAARIWGSAKQPSIANSKNTVRTMNNQSGQLIKAANLLPNRGFARRSFTNWRLPCVLPGEHVLAFILCHCQRRSGSENVWHFLTNSAARLILASAMVQRSLRSPLTKEFGATALNWTPAARSKLALKVSK